MDNQTMNIRTVAVFGAGAVGCYFLWGLAEKLGENLWLVADGERRERYAREGIYVNDEALPLNIRTPREAHGVDLLLVATKYGALKDSLAEIAAVVDEHTLVLSLLNGVDSEAILAEQIGKEHLLYSMMQIASQRKGNRVTFVPERTPGLFFGEEDGLPSARTRALEELLSGTALHYCHTPEILPEIWKKMAFNVSMNLPQAIVGCPIGAFSRSQHLANLRWRLRDEVCRVAAAQHIDISTLSAIEQMENPSIFSAKYSTLQDLEAGRHTEIEMFAGTLIRMGEQYGVPVPYCTFAYEAIKALEEQNDGKFRP